jgi:hypothetical protein
VLGARLQRLDAEVGQDREGVSLIDESRDPVLVLTAIQNELLFLVEAGDFWRAKRVLFENRPRLTTGLGRISALKLLGVEGRISYGLREFQSAERIFREVKEGFAEAGLPFAGALATLDLALALLCLERADEAEEEVLAPAEIFFSLNIKREILAAVTLMEEVVRKREGSVSEFETLLHYIRKKGIEFNLG